MTTTVRSETDLAESWLATGSLPVGFGGSAVKQYPKRSELRRAEARATTRRGADRRPAGGRPAGQGGGSHRPPAPVSRSAESGRRSHPGAPRLPIGVAPRPAVLPIPQTSDHTRPAGINVPLRREAAPDAFHRAPEPAPMVAIVVPIVDPPQDLEPGEPPAPLAPPELAAPVAPALDPAEWGLDLGPAPATGRRRAAGEAEPALRTKKAPPSAPGPLKLLGRGKAGAARLLVLALVVGAEGVAVTQMTGPARIAPLDPATDVSGAFELSSALPAAAVPADSAERQRSAVAAQSQAVAVAEAQSESSSAKVTAALKQAKAAADRVQAAAERRQRAMRDAQRSPQGVAKYMALDRGWGSGQFSCLVSLWNKESRWNYQAYNPSSGAYGIPQALPGGKMASAGSDWKTNPVTQIRWGLDYIAGRYGTPCGAWAHSQNTGWY